MKKTITVDGNEACSLSSYMFTEVAGIYPITPSSPMAEHTDEWSNQGLKNIFNDTVKVIEMQSEAGAAGFVHGSLQQGCLTTTYTASQGLLLMIPNMYKIAGEMLPGVIHVAARSLSTHALSIFGDHQDVYATRMTGFAHLASSSVSDTSYMSAISHLCAIESSIPFMHFFDGFRTSHELQKIEVLEMEDYKELVNYEKINEFRNRALNVNKPYTIGTAQNDDVYFQATEVRNKFYEAIPSIVKKYMNKINEKANTTYDLFNYYGADDATKIIVAMGSVCETIKETIDYLNNLNYKVGLVEVHLFRPFSIKDLIRVIPSSTKKIAVLDRTKETGSMQPLYLDVVDALKNHDLEIVGGIYGLASKNTTPAQIKAVYDMLDNPKNDFTIGIIDDITNKSLEIDKSFLISIHDEILIYGYGSDGMVSASKSIIKLVGDNTDKYVQGYFQYDSKKSGGVTVSHLRFSNQLIRSTYYVENPKIIVLTKDSYLKDFDVVNSIKENGVFLVNTSLTSEEFNNYLDDNTKYILMNKNIKVFTINAYELAQKVGLKNKISTIMESCILGLINLIDYNMAKEKMKKYASDRYFKKGEDIVKANYLAIDDASNYLKEISITGSTLIDVKNEKKDVFSYMQKRKGNELPTSSFLNYPGGIFESGTSALEKRCISENVPKWIKDNCTTCNFCSLVCPHGVIRPYLISDEEYLLLPDKIKERTIKQGEYYYTIAISVKDCTGCNLCINTCPSREKSLIISPFHREIEEQEIFDYLDKFIKEKEVDNKFTVKNCQFAKPKFAFSGACSGCGETPYIKLLTQLFNDNLVISNATGCSSIYGASAPSTPYTVPWASSLFEDNAEYGYGIHIANKVIRNRIKNLLITNNCYDNDLLKLWLEKSDDIKTTNYVYDNVTDLPKEIEDLKEYLKVKSVWMIGGDGWAYDIGFSGIDHVLASEENVNILVLNSEVYSNTGGQSSKASPTGSIAAFTSGGKGTYKKDLALIAMSYPNAYVAQVSLGGNKMHLLKVLNEASNYNGPSIIIAYTPCISHGIKGGLENSLENAKLATDSGYYPLFRYNPDNKKFTLDSKANFDLYEDFLMSQTRYAMLLKINKDNASSLLEKNKKYSYDKYMYYEKLDKGL